MRRITAQRLLESKTSVPHYYVTVDVRMDALLALRAQLNKALEKDGAKLSVNDLIVKASALVRLVQNFAELPHVTGHSRNTCHAMDRSQRGSFVWRGWGFRLCSPPTFIYTACTHVLRQVWQRIYLKVCLHALGCLMHAQAQATVAARPSSAVRLLTC